MDDHSYSICSVSLSKIPNLYKDDFSLAKSASKNRPLTEKIGTEKQHEIPFNKHD
ncbi:hypothetical protein R4Z10_07060 [Niallia sp. XMNu-256]|uniref:hypothetical protein n=1 Tax=Niallia sp. XMNu-256 TaxID=3082444 RepID=UPI0030D1C90B